MRRLIGLFISLILLLVLVFVVLDALGYGEAWIHERVVALRSQHGAPITGAVVFVLLVLDVALPMPSSVLMTLSGSMFGPVAAPAVNTGGALAGATIGFALCRRFGMRAFERLVGAEELPRVRAFLARYGALGVACSRGMPMLADVVSFCAGLGAMRPRQFIGWAVVGTVPVAALYAWAGAAAQGALALPVLIGVAVVVPLIAVLLARRVAPSTPSPEAPTGSGTDP